jgi:hypothetical protein
MTSPAPTTPRPLIESVADGYVPGVCNIGPWEIRRRWIGGILGLAAAAVLLALLVAVRAPAAARVLVLFPAWGGAFSVLQARRRFCGAYAMRRISNFGETLDTIAQVQDAAAHHADMVALLRMTRDALVVAVVLALLAVVAPV